MNLRHALAAAILAFAMAAPASAQNVASGFAKGRTHFFVTGGTGYAFDESYLVLGAGLTYFPLDGLGVGLSFESWSGSDPSIRKLTPSVQYVFYQARTLKPYVGAFYRRTYIEDRRDLNSLGARAGAYIQGGRNIYLGFGAVYESYQDCTAGEYRKCSSTYPEVTFTVAF
jgi:hypothetical protein